jgi:hypothetical protein
MNIKKYLNDAQNRAHESFANADGFFDDDLSFTAGEDFFGADGQANANMGAPSAPTSQPYIINITNTGAAVNNFEVLGSYEFLQSSGFSAGGSLTIGSVTISSSIPNVTYQQMLYQFMISPYSVGLTYIQSATTNQVLETISVNTKDANGNIAQKVFVPTVDPYQFQATIIAMKFGYRIDGYTKLIIQSILANATVKLYFYPADNINLARGLAGRPVSREFGSPGIVKAQSVKVIG